MKRSLTFRGWSIERDEWVEGYYGYNCEHVYYYIVVNDYEYEIVYETLGQFTGKYDIHKREIFENDIVKGEKVTMSCGDCQCCQEKCPIEYGTAIVKWNDYQSSHGGWILEGSDLHWSTLEIVGNTHNKPRDNLD